ASTGTASTCRTVAVAIVTVTGAWSQPPVARGWLGRTSTVMVGVDPEEDPGPPLAAEADPLGWEEADEVVLATFPTDETTPTVVRLSGRVMVTGSPTFTSASS